MTRKEKINRTVRRVAAGVAGGMVGLALWFLYISQIWLVDQDQALICWSALGAVGTTLAAFAAVGGWLYSEYIKPQLLKLSLEFGDGPPFKKPSLDTIAIPDTAPVGHWLAQRDMVRLRLRNQEKSKGAAYNVQVRLMGLYNAQGTSISGFDPKTLHWSETNAPGYYGLLNPSDHDYVNFLQFDWRAESILRVVGTDIELSPGKYYANLVAYAENAPARTLHLEITFGADEVNASSSAVRVLSPSSYRDSSGEREELFYLSLKSVKQIPRG